MTGMESNHINFIYIVLISPIMLIILSLHLFEISFSS